MCGIMIVLLVVILPQTNAFAETVVPQQAQSHVEILTRAEISGNPLHDVSFSVYCAIDSQRVGEVVTDTHGRAIITLSDGEYYLRNNAVQFGFLRERSRIFFTVDTNEDVTVEVTIQRDWAIPYADYHAITLPQTGELVPVVNYVFGVLCIAVAVLCGIGVWKWREENRSF